MNSTLILNLPPKFICILQDAINDRIATMQRLVDNPNTSEVELARIDYGHDQMILQSVADELKKPNTRVKADFYQLSQSADNAELTLQYFGQPLAVDEHRLLVFSANSYNDAMAIRNQFLGFAPYKPMPDTIIAEPTYYFEDEQSIEHELSTILYQPQQFGMTWQCDYQVTGYGEKIYQTIKAADSLDVIKLAISALEDCVHRFELANPHLSRQK